MTNAETLCIFAILEAGGCRPPDVIRTDTDLAINVWRTAFDAAGLDLAGATRAALAYTSEPTSDAYPKAWPSPGHILARTPSQRTRAAQIAAAPEWCERVISARGSMGWSVGTEWREPLFRHLETRRGPIGDDIRQAILAGVEALGGWHRAGLIEAKDGRAFARWDTAFREALSREPVRHALPAPPTSARIAEAK